MDLWSVSFIIGDKFKYLFSEQVEDFDGYLASTLFVNENISEKNYSKTIFEGIKNNLGEFSQSKFWTLEIILYKKPEDKKIKIKLNNLAKELKIKQYQLTSYNSKNQEKKINIITISKIANKNWLRNNRKAFPIINIDKFYIYGSHIIKDCSVNKIPIKIDASIAFGTGTHETTKCCLKAITQLSKFCKPKKILDYGCGTGILGIASKKTFKKSNITFVDIDINAKKLTKDNLIFNNIKSNNIYLTNTYFFRKYTKKNFYDLVFANILFESLYNLAPKFRFILKSHSIIILSGLLIKQVPYIVNRYNKFGFKQKKIYMMNEWATIIMILK